MTALLRKRVRLKQPSPPRKPLCDFSIWLNWRQCHAAEAAFTVDEHALVVAEIAEFVRFDFVFLGFGVVHVALAGAESP